MEFGVFDWIDTRPAPLQMTRQGGVLAKTRDDLSLAQILFLVATAS
jgi:hypothetical protein